MVISCILGIDICEVCFEHHEEGITYAVVNFYPSPSQKCK